MTVDYGRTFGLTSESAGANNTIVMLACVERPRWRPRAVERRRTGSASGQYCPVVDVPEFKKFVFPEPWLDLRGVDAESTRRRAVMVKELLVELGDDSPLASSEIQAIAMFTRQDEVLFQVDGDHFLMVHLTWARRRDEFVRVRPLPTWAAAASLAKDMASEW